MKLVDLVSNFQEFTKIEDAAHINILQNIGKLYIKKGFISQYFRILESKLKGQKSLRLRDD